MSQQNLSIFSFKQFLIQILLPVAALLLVLSLSFNYLIEKKIILGSDTNGAYKVNRIISETNEQESPILGSSRAEGGYIPSLMGEHFFNYGLSGTGADVFLFFLEEECKKKKKKTPIIINFDYTGMAYGNGDISNYLLNADYAPLREIMGQEYRQYYRIPLIKYYGKYEFYIKNYLNDKVNLTKFTNKGASIEKNKITPKKFEKLVQQRMADTMIFAKDLVLTQKLHRILAENPQRTFVFVVQPYHKSCFVNFPNKQEAIIFLADLDKRPNVKVYNFSEANYSDSLFINTTHLNYTGAKIFSKILADSLQHLNPSI